MHNFIESEEIRQYCAKKIPFWEQGDCEIAGTAGSLRIFYRMFYGDQSVIIVSWDGNDLDWERFVQLPSNDENQILPEIYHCDQSLGVVIMEDCGYDTLKKYCRDNPTERENIYGKVIEQVAHFHKSSLSTNHLVTERVLDKSMFQWESSYFSEHCAGALLKKGELCSHNQWEKECNHLAEFCSNLPLRVIHRDFQSENIMITQEDVRFVDYQGARLGPAEYDLASLLYDPYVASFSPESITDLLHYYRGDEITVENLMHCAVQRLLQALGAYGKLALVNGKKQYLSFVPIALERLNNILKEIHQYPYIQSVIEVCLDSVRDNPLENKN